MNGQVKCSGRRAFSLFLAFLLSSALALRCAQAQTAIVGVNVVGVDLASKQTKDDLLAQLQRYGVNTVRTSLGGHGEGYTDFIIEAHQRGIGAIIFIGPEAGSTNNAHALPPDKAAGRPWGIGALSDADPEGFKKWFSDELAKLEAAGVRATAFELGNELNTPRFNADFGPDKIQGRVLGLKDLENLNDSEARAVVVPFNWEPADKINNDPYNIFRCGVLSNSGKAALAPL